MSIADALKKQISTQLDQWKSEIDELEAEAKAKEAEAEADRAKADLQQEIYGKIESARNAVRDARKRIDDLSEQGEQTWSTLKTDLNKTVSELKRSLSS